MALQSDFGITEEELTNSDTAKRLGIDNTIKDPAIRDNLQALIRKCLDPVCGILNTRVHINSGYRCPAVNKAVGGSGSNPGEKPSAHMVGRAADFKIAGGTKEQLREAFDAIRRSKIPFDKLIFECDAWIHIQIAEGFAEPARKALLATRSNGAWHYSPAPPLG